MFYEVKITVEIAGKTATGITSGVRELETVGVFVVDSLEREVEGCATRLYRELVGPIVYHDRTGGQRAANRRDVPGWEEANPKGTVRNPILGKDLS